MKLPNRPEFYPNETGIGIQAQIEVNTDSLDYAIEKASRLVELLKEAQQIIGSLSERSVKEI